MDSAEIEDSLSRRKPEGHNCEELDLAIRAISSYAARKGLDADSAGLILEEKEIIPLDCEGRQPNCSTVCGAKETVCGHIKGPRFLIDVATELRLAQIEEDRISL